MFLMNNWYVVAFSTDVGSQPLARHVCGLPIVLYRTASGKVAALEDRCIHRGVPLSFGGECEGDIIRCPYHALEFGPDGLCTKVPGQDNVPPNARIFSYTSVERDGLVWIWPGDPEKADESLLVSPSYHNDEGWTWQPVFLEIEADWQMLNDNLLDLTHVGVVHKQTIGGNPSQHSGARVKTMKDGERGVKVIRHMPESDPPPLYQMATTFPGKIDRWQEIEFVPGVIKIWSGGTDAGTGAFDGNRTGGVQLKGFHGVTPSSKGSLYYHFTQAFNFEADEALREKLHEGARFTLLEDKAVIEAQQARVDETPERPFADVTADAAGLQARRIIRRLIEQESNVGGMSLHAN